MAARKAPPIRREANVFRCSWKSTRGHFRLWVTDTPSIAGEAASFQEADELLYEAIMEATGDGENLREYDPPLPIAENDLLRATITRVRPASSVTILNESALFEGGTCDVCRFPLGPRTSEAIVVDSVPKGSDGIRLQSRHLFRGPTLSAFSSTFHEALSATERTRCRWRAVKRANGKDTPFLELLGGNVHVPFVALAGIGVTLSECRACGWRRPPFYSVEAPTPAQFVASRALPDRIPSGVYVGPMQEPQLCVSAARWKVLSKQRATRQLTSDAIGVVYDFAIDHAPRYELD